MELKNFEPKTNNDFIIALILDSCVEVTPITNDFAEEVTFDENAIIK